MGLDDAGGFRAAGNCAARLGLDASRSGTSSAAGFTAAGLPYFNPHSFRDMLVHHAMTLDLTPEEMKAWSQNLGHADVLTTFTSYGNVPVAPAGRTDPDREKRR